MWLAIATVHADNGSLTSSINPSVPGQQVTFTYSFTLGCADGAQVTFTVDGDSHGAGSAIVNGIQASASYSTTFSTAGDHAIVAAFDGSPMPNCAGTSPPLVQMVSEPPPPAPPPPPDSPAPTVAAEPTPSASPTPAAAEAPSPAASAGRLNLTSNRVSTIPVSVVALLLIAVAINAGLLISRRRRRVKGAR